MTLVASLKEAGKNWMKDHASYLAAAVAYHAIFSLSPLLIVLLAVIGLLYQGSAQQEFNQALQSLVGADSAAFIRSMLAGSKIAAQSKGAFIIGTALTMIGSIGVFSQLQEAVNLVWRVKSPKQTIGVFFKRQGSLFALVMIVSVLLVVSLAASAIIARWGGVLGSSIAVPGWFLAAINVLVSFAMIVLLFGLLFKMLPAAPVRWKKVWIPALITALLFTIGKYALGLYLGRGAAVSVYGAAGSFAGLLIWIFYAAQIFLFGVELVKVRQGEDAPMPRELASTAEPLPPSKTHSPASLVEAAFLGALIGFFTARPRNKK